MRLTVLLLALLLPPAAALDNGRALTPPAGWTAWNTYSFHPTQQLLEDSLHALAKPRGPQKRSLVELGYVQANLDDAWQDCRAGVNHSFHDAAGNPLVNLRTFPNMSAMTALGASLGIEMGLYMNNCQCSESMFTDPAQIAAIVRRSAAAVARLGFLSLKLDSCGQFNNLTLWAAELNATGVAIAIENCHQGGMVPGQDRVPGQHQCSGVTPVSDCPYSSYRTSDDIQPTWPHLINNVNSLVAFLGDETQGDPPPRSRPGGWAYGDAIQTGSMGVLSWSGYTPRPDGWSPEPLVEDRSDFGLHCITSSPLILSFNLTNETTMEMVWPIVANEEAIAVNRQWAGTPGRLVATIRPAGSGGSAAGGGAGGGYVLRRGQIGKADGWGHDVQSAHDGLICQMMWINCRVSLLPATCCGWRTSPWTRRKAGAQPTRPALGSATKLVLLVLLTLTAAAGTRAQRFTSKMRHSLRLPIQTTTRAARCSQAGSRRSKAPSPLQVRGAALHVEAPSAHRTLLRATWRAIPSRRVAPIRGQQEKP
jgi:hypothetical protein